MASDDPTLTSSDGGWLADPQPAPDLLVGRYALGELLGRGGSGQVHRAHDRLTGEAVAVKFVHGAGAAVRRELTALRLLDLPGVVRLRDDGEDGEQTFLVMELLEGGTLARLAGTYDRWAPAARTVCETLVRVHRAGVVHRDLKPSNVLLDQDDRPVLADFGLAHGAPVDAAADRAGTPRYMAPEQRAGLPCDARTDLYALGGILRDLADGHPLPAPVAAIVAACLQPDPAARPSSAEEVLAALGGDPLDGTLARVPDRVDEEVLRPWIEDTAPSFLHLADDAAAALLRGARGKGEVVRARIAAWVRAGRAVWVGDRLRVTRAALDRLAARAPPADPLAAADRAERRGDLRRAVGILELLAAQPDAPPALLARLAAAALASRDPALLRHAAYRAQRAGDGAVLAVLRAEAALRQGEAARALELSAAPHPDPALDLWRRVTRHGAWARIAPPEEQERRLEEDRPWAERTRARYARWLLWKGHAAYAAGRYADCVTLNELAAVLLARAPIERARAATNAAAAALEQGAPERALAHAEAARTLAARLRQPALEARATWLVRAALYRSGQPAPPSPGWVDAAAAVHGLVEGQLALTEAAFAWRGADLALAGALAARAAAAFARLGFADAELLARGLAVACAGGSPAEVVERARAAKDGTLALQALALAGADPADLPVEAWLARWHLPPDARADVLTRREVEVALTRSPRRPARRR